MWLYVLNAVPEIEQGLSDAANSKITVSFTPHLMPMVIINILLNSYVSLSSVTLSKY